MCTFLFIKGCNSAQNYEFETRFTAPPCYLALETDPGKVLLYFES